jgi:hypothetical protein
VLGKQKYLAARAAEHDREFGITAGQTDRRLNLTKRGQDLTDAYHQSSLRDQRKKAKADTGIDTTSALKILNSGKANKVAGLTLGKQGQSGGLYNIYGVLQTAADNINGVTIYDKPRQVLIKAARRCR